MTRTGRLESLCCPTPTERSGISWPRTVWPSGQPLSPATGRTFWTGNALPLKNIPLGTMIHNVELKQGKGGQMVRAAGGAAQLLAKESGYAQIKAPSGETRMVHLECYATIGQVGNLDHENISVGKAGRSRWLGKRPTVRGVAMNPIDHPHGGGEGKTSGRASSGEPLGVADKRIQDQKQQTHSALYHQAPRQEVGGLFDGEVGQKRPIYR